MAADGHRIHMKSKENPRPSGICSAGLRRKKTDLLRDAMTRKKKNPGRHREARRAVAIQKGWKVKLIFPQTPDAPMLILFSTSDVPFRFHLKADDVARLPGKFHAKEMNGPVDRPVFGGIILVLDLR